MRTLKFLNYLINIYVVIFLALFSGLFAPQFLLNKHVGFDGDLVAIVLSILYIGGTIIALFQFERDVLSSD